MLPKFSSFGVVEMKENFYLIILKTLINTSRNKFASNETAPDFSLITELLASLKTKRLRQSGNNG